LDTQPEHVVFYDGVCRLCNRYIHFILSRDREEQFYFAPLEGEYARKLLPDELRSEADESIVYLRRINQEKQFSQRSEAVIQILSDLGGYWRWGKLLRVIPRFVRDKVYDFIARNRYKWFGKYDSCPAPEPGWKQRFLD